MFSTYCFYLSLVYTFKIRKSNPALIDTAPDLEDPINSSHFTGYHRHVLGNCLLLRYHRYSHSAVKSAGTNNRCRRRRWKWIWYKTNLQVNVSGDDRVMRRSRSSGSHRESVSQFPITLIPAPCYLGMSTDSSHYTVFTTSLFLIAKKRQWAMREVITRSARRATQAIKTPLSARFPRSQTPRGMGSEFSASRVEERSQKLKVNPMHNDIEKNSLITETEKARNGGNGRAWGSVFSSRHS